MVQGAIAWQWPLPVSRHPQSLVLRALIAHLAATCLVAPPGARHERMSTLGAPTVIRGQERIPAHPLWVAKLIDRSVR